MSPFSHSKDPDRRRSSFYISETNTSPMFTSGRNHRGCFFETLSIKFTPMNFGCFLRTIGTMSRGTLIQPMHSKVNQSMALLMYL
ncbi:hypothetical protein L1887_09092 [Cichorium endivia]|nr:hypothetical protein L1887_09092 [Cichorium endivia]